MNVEELFLKKYGNKITASESWVIRFANEYAELKVNEALSQPIVSGCNHIWGLEKEMTITTRKCACCGLYRKIW